jgi:hypothetical protein
LNKNSKERVAENVMAMRIKAFEPIALHPCQARVERREPVLLTPARDLSTTAIATGRAAYPADHSGKAAALPHYRLSTVK